MVRGQGPCSLYIFRFLNGVDQFSSIKSEGIVHIGVFLYRSSFRS